MIDRAVEAAGAGAGVEWSFQRVVDAMRAEGLIAEQEGRLSASDALARATEAALALQAGAAARLREACVAALEGRVHALDRRQALVDDIFDDLGLIVRESLQDLLPGAAGDSLVRRLNAVERRIAAQVRPTGGTAAEAMRALVDVVAASPYGRAMAAAELFVQMSRRESSHLAMALTRRDKVQVWLDTSVALPMLCGLHDRVVRGWPASAVAVELHGALRDRGVEMVVPSVYVEEMAAHLIEAARRYRDLVGADPALARSENFFVAHFHAAAAPGEPLTPERFDRFLRGFGLPEGWKNLDERNYERLRRTIEIEIEQLFRSYYRVGYGRLVSTDAVPLPDEPPRTAVVLKHDRCVVRELEEQDHHRDEGRVLCSEDRWLVQVFRDRLLPALHPAALVDLVQIVRPSDEPRELATVREMATRITDRALTQGAAVWDMLAELRDPQLTNRELLERAREFKEAWLARGDGEERPHAEDWQRFKAARELER